MEQRERARVRDMLWPGLLIALGLVLLLTNLGIVPAVVWRTLWPYWPVLLVLLGLQLLLTGRAAWGATILTLAIVAAVGTITGVYLPSLGLPWAAPAARVDDLRIVQPLGAVQMAEVRLNVGPARLSLGSGAEGDMLLEGSASNAWGQPTTRYSVQDGVGRLDFELIRPAGAIWLFRAGRASDAVVELNLARAVPIRQLEVRAGASDVSLDLRDLQVQNLDLDAAASRIRITLPGQGITVADIDGAAGRLELDIPPGVAAWIRADGAVADYEVDEVRFPQIHQDGLASVVVDREYRSPGFETAPNRVELRITGAAASVEIR
ncbi:MAG: hypothetical protein GEU73_14695 [Chloroflexi bacterium]|nr:hypothetical protein [Chloroflexota bacterium]